MLKLTLAQAAQAVGGALHGPAGLEVRGVFTDTRKPLPGALFVALRGPHFDAHEFLATAAEAGAVAALVERRQEIALPQIVVGDTRLALGCLAAAWRTRWPGRMVALTGSNGKTTTKEMLAAILRERGPTLATRGNLNNDIGVPLMLAELDPDQSFAVIEMGANHPGEIAYLGALARPHVALVTNTGHAHIEGFGGLWGVVRSKGEIFGALREGGLAVLNVDDKSYPFFAAINPGRSLSFAMQEGADVCGAWQPLLGGGRLMLRTSGEAISIDLPVPGEHNARNALAAASAALALGFELEEIKAGLESSGEVPGRLQRKRGPEESVLWDDTYNANPDSLRAGIEAVRGQGGETWLVLGDMGELGPESAVLHAESGRLARTLGVARLFAVGPLALHAAQAFGPGAEHFTTIETLVAALDEALRPGIHVLIKGSRSSRMERVVQALEEPSC
jgi:UDP-N-acetylmuramoyl-tripeptide--D-alanyl-D-alanine ligase